MSGFLSFRHLPFKLAVVNVLMYEKKVMGPEFRLRDARAGGAASGKPAEEALEYFRNLQIPAELAPLVEEIDEIDQDVIFEVLPDFDGESTDLDVVEVDEDEIRQLPNLKKINLHSPNAVPVFSSCRVVASVEGDLNEEYPFFSDPAPGVGDGSGIPPWTASNVRIILRGFINWMKESNPSDHSKRADVLDVSLKIHHLRGNLAALFRTASGPTKAEVEAAKKSLDEEISRILLWKSFSPAEFTPEKVRSRMFERRFWDQLDGADKRRLLRPVIENSGLKMDGVQKFSMNGLSLETVVLEGGGAKFVFIPGDEAEVGILPEGLPDDEGMMAEASEALSEYDVDDPIDFMIQMTKPRRKVRIAPMIVEQSALKPTASSVDALKRSYAEQGARLPTPDEWAYLAGSAAGTLYAWGRNPLADDETPYYGREEPFDYVNGLGMRIGLDPYRCEIVEDDLVHALGGDGGSLACGGLPASIEWIPTSPCARESDLVGDADLSLGFFCARRVIPFAELLAGRKVGIKPIEADVAAVDDVEEVRRRSESRAEPAASSAQEPKMTHEVDRRHPELSGAGTFAEVLSRFGFSQLREA